MNSVLKTMKSLNLLEESKVRWKSRLTLHLYLTSFQARHYHTEFLISQSLGTVGCVKDIYGFFSFDIHFLSTSLLLSNVMLQNFVKLDLVSWCWVTQRYTYLLPIYAL